MPQKIVSHYEIERKIGEGGMGEVYLARDLRLDRPVALKFLPEHLSRDAKARERLLREAKAASKLSHPNILTIHEVGEDEDGNIFIAMAYVDGLTLDQLIDRSELPIPRVLAIAIQIGEGLARAHAAGVIHRDIKPQNVLVDGNGHVTILDFGLAKIFDAAKLTQTGTLIGTMSYMSPEQARGEVADQRSDIYAFGAVLYEMVAGRPPFDGDNPAAVLYGIINEQPVPPSRVNGECTPGLESIILAALAKNPANRFQTIEQMLDGLRCEQAPTGSPASNPSLPPTLPEVPRPSRRRWLRYLAPAALVFAAAVALMVLVPARFRFVADQEAHADRNTLAVMYFDSVTDPADTRKTAQMITNLLITDLSESQYMSVVSQQRLFDILKNLGHVNTTMIDRTVASDVAQEAGASWILTGSILQVEPSYILVSSVSDAVNGRILASQRAEGAVGEDLFAVVDRLGAAVRDDLALPKAAAREENRPLGDVVTHSEGAYKSYLAGMECMLKLDYITATTAFSEAVATDTTFAMAYYQLSRAQRSRMMFSDANRAADNAARFADHATPLERLYIASEEAIAQGQADHARDIFRDIVEQYPSEKEAYKLLADMYLVRHEGAEAAALYEKVLALDPSDKIAYNNLTYAYQEAGNYDKAIEAINRYIALAPDEPNPYDTRGDMYAGQGRTDEAMVSYRAALERKSDFTPSIGKLGSLHLARREYAEADSVYRLYFKSPNREDHAMGRTCLALIPMAQGRMQAALRTLAQGIAADELEKVDLFHTTWKHLMCAEIHSTLGDPAAAVSECASGVALAAASGARTQYFPRALYATYLAAAGRTKEAADSLAALESAIRRKDTSRIDVYNFTAGRIAHLSGDYASAVAHLKSGMLPANPFMSRFELAGAYLDAGQLGEATSLFKQLLQSYDEHRTSSVIMSVRAHYLLGCAYEQSGWNVEALEQYREFLAYWGKGDMGLKEVNDARARIVRLQTRT